MIPAKLELKIWSGCSFNLELVTQAEVYEYDPDVHNSPADHRRSFSENLDYYGSHYEFIDFMALYARSELRVYQSWKMQGVGRVEPVCTLSSLSGTLIHTSKSIVISLDADATKQLEFTSGLYVLDLYGFSDGEQKFVDRLVYGDISVLGEDRGNNV